MAYDVRDVQERFDQAELAGDRAALELLIADDFQSIGPRGFVLDKQQWIGRHAEFTYHPLAAGDRTVHAYGDTAIVRNLQRTTASYRQREAAVSARVSQVWVRRDGERRLAGIQFSPLAEG